MTNGLGLWMTMAAIFLYSQASAQAGFTEAGYLRHLEQKHAKIIDPTRLPYLYAWVKEVSTRLNAALMEAEPDVNPELRQVYLVDQVPLGVLNGQTVSLERSW